MIIILTTSWRTEKIIFYRLKILLAIFLILSSLNLYSQVEGTVILVRHAEKQKEGKDPELSEEGRQRSEKLKFTLGKMDLDAVFSTDFKRTRATIGPVAEDKGIKLQSYSPTDRQFILDYLKANPGDAVLISGHSNTIPGLYNFLANDSISDFDDSDYSNLIIIILSEKEDPRVVWLQY